MKKTLPALLLAGVLLLTGCSAMLNRPYTAVSPHPEYPVMSEDDSGLAAGNYSELVEAVLYCVSRTMTEGRILLADYDGDAVADLNEACLEVAKDDPLGAYAVDFIQTEYTRVLTDYEATVSITYRRTPEQVQSLVNVTGASAIRRVLGAALADFRSEVALRVGYFAEDEEYIRTLVRQAYYDTPAAAQGMPELTVFLYPDQGSRRIVEILLAYSDEPEVLRRKRDQAAAAAEEIAATLTELQEDPSRRLNQLLAVLPGQLTYTRASREDGTAPDTAWDALVGDGGDAQGVALAFRLLYEQIELDCTVAEGTRDGTAHFWNTLTDKDGKRLHVDLSRSGTPRSFTDEELAGLGYLLREE